MSQVKVNVNLILNLDLNLPTTGAKNDCFCR